MNMNMNMNMNIKQVFVWLATIITIGVNALAVILPLNSISTKEISDSFDTYFVPVGYVFSIWGIIYLLLILFAIGYTFIFSSEKKYIENIYPLYLFSAFLNCVWIFLWHYGFFFTTVVVMVSLLVTLILIYRILLQNKTQSWKETLFLHAPFSVYLGWISVATIANISDALWLLNWSAFGITGPIWAAIMMGIAGLLAVIMTLFKKDKLFALVIIWALVGIIVKFPDQMIMKYTGLSVIGVVGLALLVEFVKSSIKKS